MAYAHRVEPGKPFHMKDVDPSSHDGLTREKTEAELQRLGTEMRELLDLLYYAGETALLIVLQGRDTSGKDGTIRHLLDFTNVQSCRVVPFKVPTAEEAAHDFLWRIHRETPRKGSIAIFNRSQYEDVLVVRVHKLVPEAVWKARFDHINHFERVLTDSNTILLKFYLHISKDAQEQRLLEREKETEKAWKLSVDDWKERALWDEYSAAYEDAITRCSTASAPWYVVPANHKRFRDLAITEQVVHALRPYRARWMAKLHEIGVEAKAEIDAYRAGKG